MSDPRSPKPAEASTKTDIESFVESLPTDSGKDAENVARGFIATREDPIIARSQPSPQQNPVWDLSRADFINDPLPETVNPSLWRLSLIHI